jgi:hypothetical protein
MELLGRNTTFYFVSLCTTCTCPPLFVAGHRRSSSLFIRFGFARSVCRASPPRACSTRRAPPSPRAPRGTTLPAAAGAAAATLRAAHWYPALRVLLFPDGSLCLHCTTLHPLRCCRPFAVRRFSRLRLLSRVDSGSDSDPCLFPSRPTPGYHGSGHVAPLSRDGQPFPMVTVDSSRSLNCSFC